MPLLGGLVMALAGVGLSSVPMIQMAQESLELWLAVPLIWMVLLILEMPSMAETVGGCDILVVTLMEGPPAALLGVDIELATDDRSGAAGGSRS